MSRVFYTEDQIRVIYEEISQMQITLDADPLALGPKKLNAKLAEVKNQHSRCSQILLQVSHDQSLFKADLARERGLFNLDRQQLLATDPQVRAGHNISDREALVAVRLRNQIEKVQGFEIAVGNLKMLMEVLKTKLHSLRDTQRQINTQIRVCEQEIGLGARWGAGLMSGTQIGASSEQLGQLDSLLGNVAKNLNNEESETAEESDSTSDDVDLFLQSCK